jgi:hypothetical protein
MLHNKTILLCRLFPVSGAGIGKNNKIEINLYFPHHSKSHFK